MTTPSEGHPWKTFREPRERLVDLPDLPDAGGSMAQRIAAVLAGGIAGGTFRQGEALPPAASIAHRYGVSVDTARAAVRALISHSLAYRQPGGHAYVRGTRRCEPDA